MSIFDIADDIVTLLNYTVDPEDETDVYPFTYPFTAAVQLLPKFKKSELENWNVTVFPVSEVPTNDTRNSYYADCTIQVGLMKRISNDTLNTDVRAYGEFANQVMQFMFNKNLSNGKFISIKNDPIYSIESLNDSNVFTSIIEVVYRYWYTAS